MQPLVDDLYLVVAIALVASVAVGASAWMRRLGGRTVMGPVAVVVAAVLVLVLQPVRRTDPAALDAGAVDVADIAEVAPPAAAPPPTVPIISPPPPAMRRVPVPTSTP